VVSVRLRIPAGSAHDPADATGTANLTAQLTTRGTMSRDREMFDQAVDDLGAQLSVASGREFVEASLTCLAGDLPAALDLVSEALTVPSFPEQELDRVRQETLAAIKQAENDTSTVAAQGLRELLFRPATRSATRRSGRRSRSGPSPSRTSAPSIGRATRRPGWSSPRRAASPAVTH
jgi:zinc protease